MAAILLPAAAGAGRALRPSLVQHWSRGPLPSALAVAQNRCQTSTVPAAAGNTSDVGGSTHLHATANEGPQPETLFRPDVASLAGAASEAAFLAGEGEGEQQPLREGELPGFTGLPSPDYEAERPQPQTAPEPENPLPEGLPPNHPQREGEEAPEGPTEVPLPRIIEPDLPSQRPPEIVPNPGPLEMPPREAPWEMPNPSAPPEFTPSAPSEVPDRGGSEINFP